MNSFHRSFFPSQGTNCLDCVFLEIVLELHPHTVLATNGLAGEIRKIGLPALGKGRKCLTGFCGPQPFLEQPAFLIDLRGDL